MKMALSLVAAVTVSGLLFTGSAKALECSVTGPTGPGSTNECVVKERCKIDIENNNDIDVRNNNNQSSESGDATSSDNTGGGGATSGNASNSSNTGVDIGIKNGGANCEEESNVVTPPNNEENNVTPGRGAGEVQGVSTTTPGGRGAGEVQGASQVAAPVGGVGAGAGSTTLAALATSIAGIGVGALRLRKLHNA